MTIKIPTLLDNDTLGATAISLLSNSLAPATYANYDNALRHFFAFCEEENLPPCKRPPLRWSATQPG
jgi:hypothetical protein